MHCASESLFDQFIYLCNCKTFNRYLRIYLLTCTGVFSKWMCESECTIHCFEPINLWRGKQVRTPLVFNTNMKMRSAWVTLCNVIIICLSAGCQRMWRSLSPWLWIMRALIDLGYAMLWNTEIYQTVNKFRKKSKRFNKW